MHPTDHAQKATVAPSHDGFFPSARFAKVPAEALDALAYEGPHKLSHAEFRLFVALCRFRGITRIVNPCQETLAAMTGIVRSNVSRTAQSLQAKGWVRIHHVDGDSQKRVSNYELFIPVRGVSPGVASKPKKTRMKASGLDVARNIGTPIATPMEAGAGEADTDDARSRIEREDVAPPDYPDADVFDDDSLTDEELSGHLAQVEEREGGVQGGDAVRIEGAAWYEPMSSEELDALTVEMDFAED